MIHFLNITKGAGMINLIIKLHTELSRLMEDKINIVILLLVVNLIFTNYAYTRIKKKIDHRYFNNVNTLQQIYDVKIDTLNGDLKDKVILHTMNR